MASSGNIEPRVNNAAEEMAVCRGFTSAPRVDAKFRVDVSGKRILGDHL
jgi:hypothetical protein